MSDDLTVREHSKNRRGFKVDVRLDSFNLQNEGRKTNGDTFQSTYDTVIYLN